MIYRYRTYVTHLLLALLALIALPGCSLIITDSSVATLEPSAPGQPIAAEETPAGPGEAEMDTQQLIAALGATAGDNLDDPLFDAPAQWIELNGALIQLYEFADAAAAEAAAGTVSGGGTIIGTTTVDWIETPHFYRSGRLLALYAGDDEAVLSALEANLGAPFLVGVTMLGDE